VIIAAGKFHLKQIVRIILESGGTSYGVISPQTPTGSLIVTTLFPAIEAGIVSP
jgi:hypothetical protein